MSPSSSFDWPLLTSRFPLVAEQILSHLTCDDLDSCSRSCASLRVFLSDESVRRRLEDRVLCSSWLDPSSSSYHTYDLLPRFRQRKVDYWTFDRGEFFVILRDYRLRVYDAHRGLRGEIGVGAASDYQLSDCQEFFLSFTSELVLLHVRFRRVIFLICRRTLRLVAREDPPGHLLLHRAVGEHVISVFEQEEEEEDEMTTPQKEKKKLLKLYSYCGPGDPYRPLATVPDCHDGCGEPKAEEVGEAHFVRACDHGRLVLADLKLGRRRSTGTGRIRHRDLFQNEMDLALSDRERRRPRRRLECLRLGRRHLAASFSEGDACLVFVERDIDQDGDDGDGGDAPLRRRFHLRLPGCYSLPDNVDGTCLSLSDGLFVVSSPRGPDLQRLHLLDLRTGRMDTCEVAHSYVDMIHIIRDRLLLFICHRDPDLFDFGGTVHLLCVATKRHRVLPTPLTMYSRMSDLPNHCIHVVSDSAIVFRPSISDNGLYLCSVKRPGSYGCRDDDDDGGGGGEAGGYLFFERKEREPMCQIM